MDFPDGAVWDFNVVPDAAGLMADGTYDTFDLAMILLVNAELVTPVSPTNVPCNTDSYGFTVHGESIYGLKITRNFYVPQGDYQIIF